MDDADSPALAAHRERAAARFVQAAQADPLRTLIALDVDGTVAAIAESPSAAALRPDMRATLERLSTRYRLWFMSGRDADEAKRIVGIEAAGYVGAHGIEVLDERSLRPLVALAGVQPDLAKLAQAVAEDVPEAAPYVERKRWSVAFHYRALPHPGNVAKRLEESIRRHVSPNLRLLPGKKVYEVLPAGAYNKGTALRWLIDSLQPRRVLAAGDDATDLAMFRALAESNESDRLTIAVHNEETPRELIAAADLVVDGVDMLYTLIIAKL